jgi:hypothetical protein
MAPYAGYDSPAMSKATQSLLQQVHLLLESLRMPQPQWPFAHPTSPTVEGRGLLTVEGEAGCRGATLLRCLVCWEVFFHSGRVLHFERVMGAHPEILNGFYMTVRTPSPLCYSLLPMSYPHAQRPISTCPVSLRRSLVSTPTSCGSLGH